MPTRSLRLLVTLLAILVVCPPVRAAEQEQPAPTPPATPRPVLDPLGRETPQGAVKGFLAATREGDYTRAARYLELRDVPEAESAELARHLELVLLRTVPFDVAQLSDDPEGLRDDGLPADMERIGWVEPTADTEKPLAAELRRVRNDQHVRIWLFAAESVSALSAFYDNLGYDRLDAFLPPVLFDVEVFHVQLWQWLALFASLLLAAGAAWAGASLVVRLLRPLARRTATTIDDRLLELGISPLRLGVGVVLFSAARVALGLPLSAANALHVAESFLLAIAITWAALRLLDVVAGVIEEKLRRRGLPNAVLVLPPGRRTAKVLVVCLGVLLYLDSLGFDVTAVLAGLGVGGIAVALAAQKSVENLFGGVTLYADQPLRVGDFCRVQDHSGTVEDIGLRSTRLRTPERTMVTIPNSELANLAIENLSRRDRMWYHPKLGLRYETTPEQLRAILDELRALLHEHRKVVGESARVTFVGFGAWSLDVEVSAFIRTTDGDEYSSVAEELNLRMMDIVTGAGTSFALPSQTTYIEPGLHEAHERAPRDGRGEHHGNGQAR